MYLFLGLILLYTGLVTAYVCYVISLIKILIYGASDVIMLAGCELYINLFY
jgi:hypothetical protein